LTHDEGPGRDGDGLAPLVQPVEAPGATPHAGSAIGLLGPFDNDTVALELEPGRQRDRSEGRVISCRRNRCRSPDHVVPHIRPPVQPTETARYRSTGLVGEGLRHAMLALTGKIALERHC
jgi:hypothetical protein